VLGIKTIVCFACVDFDQHRPVQLREAVLPYLRKAALRAAEEGMVLAVETEFMSGVETARDAFELVSAVKSEAFRVNWDVANAWIAGELPLEGYEYVRDHLANIHVKDAITKDWQAGNPFVTLGQGLIDWKPLLQRLVRDEALNLLTVETHVEPLLECSQAFVKELNRLLAEIEVHEGEQK
jgi:sugar phosphate isomerase/epimerase